MAIPIVMPRMNWSQESGILVSWLKASGEYVKAGEPLLIVETEKAEVEVEADNSGFLHPLASATEVFAVGALIGYLLADGEAPPAPSRSAAKPEKPGEAAGSGQSPEDAPRRPATGDTKATPVARRLARELGIEIAAVTGSGRDGTVTERDVRAHLDSQQGRVGEGPEERGGIRPKMPSTAASAEDHSGQLAEVIHLNAVRRATAQRLTMSFATVPHFYLRVTVDMTEAERLRASHDPQPSVTAVIARAVAVTLAAHPEVNCSYADGAVSIMKHTNIGIAVSTSEGLLVPVIHDANELSLQQLDQRIRELRIRADERRFKASEFAGGTFTISNLGMFGVDGFSAVINPPEAAILAVGGLQDRPYKAEAGIEFRPTLELTLSIDHRALDGADGARFLADLKRLLEQPAGRM